VRRISLAICSVSGAFISRAGSRYVEFDHNLVSVVRITVCEYLDSHWRITVSLRNVLLFSGLPARLSRA